MFWWNYDIFSFHLTGQGKAARPYCWGQSNLLGGRQYHHCFKTKAKGGGQLGRSFSSALCLILRFRIRVSLWTSARDAHVPVSVPGAKRQRRPARCPKGWPEWILGQISRMACEWGGRRGAVNCFKVWNGPVSQYWTTSYN